MGTDDNDDDAFQTNPGDDNPMQQITDDEKQPEDNDTPFSPPSGVQDRLDDTAPQTDTDIDEQEHYDEGIEGASTDLPGEAADEEPEAGVGKY